MDGHDLDQLAETRRRAKERADWALGEEASLELVRRRGGFGDWCWVAWFKCRHGDLEGALRTIQRARAMRPDEAKAEAFESGVLRLLAEKKKAHEGEGVKRQLVERSAETQERAPRFEIKALPMSKLEFGEYYDQFLVIDLNSGKQRAFDTLARAERYISEGKE